MIDGACHDRPDIDMFPVDAAGVTEAQAVCAGCPVIDECREYALENRIVHGVWGGLSERARRRLHTKRRLLKACSWCGKPVEVTVRYRAGRLVAGAAEANRRYHPGCWDEAERERLRVAQQVRRRGVS